MKNLNRKLNLNKISIFCWCSVCTFRCPHMMTGALGSIHNPDSCLISTPNLFEHPLYSWGFPQMKQKTSERQTRLVCFIFPHLMHWRGILLAGSTNISSVLRLSPKLTSSFATSTSFNCIYSVLLFLFKIHENLQSNELTEIKKLKVIYLQLKI